MSLKFEIFEHLYHFWLLTGQAGNMRVETDETKAVISGIESPSFNAIALNKEDDSLINDLKNKNIQFLAFPRESFEYDFDSYINAKGLNKVGTIIANIFEVLTSFNYVPREDIFINVVTNKDTLKDFDSVSSLSLGHNANYAYQYLYPILDNAEINSKIKMIVGYKKDKPIACGILSLFDKMAGLHWGGVVPEHRNQGIATELVKYRLNIAKQRGYTKIVAHNMTPSIGYYKKLGFISQGELPLYLYTKN